MAKDITQIIKKKTPDVNFQETEKKVLDTLVEFINLTSLEFGRIDKIYGTSLHQRLVFNFNESSLSFFFNVFEISHSVRFLSFRNEERVTPDGRYYDISVPDSFEMPRMNDVKFEFGLKVRTIHSILRQRRLWRPKDTSPRDGKIYHFNDIAGYELYVANPTDTITLYWGSDTVKNEKDVSQRIRDGHRAWVSFNEVGEHLRSLSPDMYLKRMIEEIIRRKGSDNNIRGSKTFYAGFTRDLGTALDFVSSTKNYYEFEIPREVLIDANNLISYTINTENEMLTPFATHPSWLKRVVRDGVEIYSRDK